MNKWLPNDKWLVLALGPGFRPIFIHSFIMTNDYLTPIMTNDFLRTNYYLTPNITTTCTHNTRIHLPISGANQAFNHEPPPSPIATGGWLPDASLLPVWGHGQHRITDAVDQPAHDSAGQQQHSSHATASGRQHHSAGVTGHGGGEGQG